MKSFERSYRSADLDQRNPEHLNRETAEFSWDDLSKVPFRGNQQNGQVNSKDAVKSVKEMKAIIDSLPSDVDDEIKRAAGAVEARRQAQETFNKMRDVGSFGRGSRNERNIPPAKEHPIDEDDFNKSLSDISATF
ncbi:hypothetical protein IKG24_01670 [Candidatus Saccharibacteria bacterium]|nr:hypothetical protein [Candidatus Saccharibacteria bacterium]